MAENLSGYVAQDTTFAQGEGGDVPIKANKMGNLVVIDWFTEMALEGRAYNVRAGTVTTPLVGDILITDQAAEMAADASTGQVIVPAYLNIAIRLAVAGVTLHEYAAKSVSATPTAAGAAAFVPLPLLLGGTAAGTVARVAAAGGVTVATEAATTTRRHWNYANPLAVAAGHGITIHEWAPIAPPTINGPASFYIQIAANTTGPSYYASFDYVELTTAAIS
jgi:hypothetical protein